MAASVLGRAGGCRRPRGGNPATTFCLFYVGAGVIYVCLEQFVTERSVWSRERSVWSRERSALSRERSALALERYALSRERSVLSKGQTAD